MRPLGQAIVKGCEHSELGDGAVPNFTGAGVMAVRERGRSAGILPVKSRAGTKGLTGGDRLPEEERSRESEASEADGWGRSVSGWHDASAGRRGGWAVLGRVRRGGCGHKREWAGNGPAEEGEGFSFFLFFFFPISISLIPFSFKQKFI
jgi:hypothetical protein